MQVVRVSGTIRKAEEEVIRRARAAILEARRESHDGTSSRLDAILGRAKEGATKRQLGKNEDLAMEIEDGDDCEDDEEDEEDMDEDD